MSLPGEKSLIRACLSVLLCCAVLAAIAVPPAFAETKQSEKVTFNFIDVELPAITKFISDITKKNFIFDDRVKGKITIIAPSKLSVEEAFQLFVSVLELKGFTVVPSGVDAYKIVAASEAKQKGLELVKDRQPGTEPPAQVNESYIARLIVLKNISSDEALRFIQPVVSKDGYSSAFGPGNLLLVIDSGLNIEKVVSIIESIDRPSLRELPEIIFLKHASADAVAKVLNEGVGRKQRGGVPQAAAGDEARAVADQRLNAVVLFGEKSTRESMKSVIALLDVPSQEAQGRINVYFLENADAVELSKVLEGIVRAAQVQRQQAGAAPGAVQAVPFEAVGGITVTADKASNALIIVASPGDYQNFLQVIKQLDKKRRQVFVEAMIIEASIDNLSEIGVKWRVTGTHHGEPVVIGGFGTIDSEAVQNIITGLQGVSVGGLANFLNIPITTSKPGGGFETSTLTIPGFAALFSLVDFKDAIDVLSTPQILTSDNKEAQIMVGENVPFITKKESDPTRTASVFSTIERTDVGIILKITPQITEGDYVKLDIYQEISALKNENELQVLTLGPTTTKRSTKTSVAVKDQQTVVIGGLIQERTEENVTKMPILGDIPVLKWLFTHKSYNKKKTNLLVFLTPHIVKEPVRLGQLTQQKKREFEVAEKRYVQGELLVKFREGVTDERAREIISKQGATVIKLVEGIRVYHIRFEKRSEVEEVAREFAALPEVEYAEPNYTLRMKQE